MESNRGGTGIQALLAAEQEAQRTVNDAKTANHARLKQAKDEAEKEIAEFRVQMEVEFRVQRRVAQSTRDTGANLKRLELETDVKIKSLKGEAARIADDVVQMMLRHVNTVKN